MWMHHHRVMLQGGHKSIVASSQMVDPHRCAGTPESGNLIMHTDFVD
jgi:hypothetical protein